MKQMTQRQAEILEYLREFIRREGFWPSIRDVQDHFGFRSTNAVMGHLRALERKGCMSRIPGQARTFRLLAEDVLPEGAMETEEIPVYGAIAAGYPDRVESSGEVGRLLVDIHTANIRRGGKTFALRVTGESMIGAGIQNGDMVVVHPGIPQDGDIVAALIDGETTLKRYVHPRGGTPYLKAENPSYPELYPTTELLIQGICRAVIRNL